MSPDINSYEQALEYLYSRIDYERVKPSSYQIADFQLERMQLLLEALGSPHLRIPAVHVAGTKGKGSTCCMIAAVLQEAGYRTALLTSPHLNSFEERLRVQGESPSQDRVVDLVRTLARHVEAVERENGTQQITYFELTTALAWLYFAEEGAEVAVLEVGMGGRLDATNLCRPEVCIITSISRDHTQQLGNELASIAREKAGIIKAGAPVISGVTQPEPGAVIASVAAAQGSELLLLNRDFHWSTAPEQSQDFPPSRFIHVRTRNSLRENLRVPLMGEHQAHNTALAVCAVEVLRERGWRVSEEALRTGFNRVSWPARIEVIRRNPYVVLDAAHNWASTKALVKTLDENFHARRKTLIFAATTEKDVAGMLRQIIPHFDTILLTTYRNNPRGETSENLLRLARQLTARPVHRVEEPYDAWKLAVRFTGEKDLICVAGSLFLAAEIREIAMRETADENDAVENAARR
ncbi:MAG: folylpolyglutamate synthase/dihydrofolate synthase family protein [Planctomycetales bacterium]